MAVTYSTFTHFGLYYQQYPPPLLPKPGKDNVRLQKLLKRSAKKKSSVQVSQSVAPFRSSLSPVDEASPDQEHSDHSTPPKTPETPHYGVPQHPRFAIRPLYQHVASPYPQRAMYDKPVRFSPQTAAIPSLSFSHQVLTGSYLVGASPVQGPVAQSPGSKISVPSSFVSEVTVLAGEDKVAAFAESYSGLEPAEMVVPQQKHSRLGPVPFTATGGQAVTRPLTVLTPLIKPKSPRPTFKATEQSRSPKPMFDVPQIRMYTANTSYYETSRTPPVFDTPELTSIGSTVPPVKILTETPRGLTPTTDIQRGTAPTPPSPLLGADSQPRRSSEAQRGMTPTKEMRRAPPTEETSRVITSTSDVKRKMQTSEIRVKTPTYEFEASKTSTGRPRTPANYVTRTTTPVFEVSKPNPLLFAVIQSTADTERPEPPKLESAASSLTAPLSVEPDFDKRTPNGDVHIDVAPAESLVVKPIQESITKLESEPEQTVQQIPAAQLGPQRPPSPTEPMLPAASPSGYQRSRTPTYEASRLITAATGYKRPRTPTRGSSPSGRSPVAFQRPKTPTQVTQKSKSAYCGLTPAEYAAYGGIKTYSPAFGITASKTPSQEEVKTSGEEPTQSKIPRQDPAMKDETPLQDDKGPGTPLVPSIVVVIERIVTPQEIKVASDQPAIQEKIKLGPSAAETKSAEKQNEAKTAHEDIKPKSSEKSQDPLKVVRKLLGKEKVQSAENKDGTEKKSEVLDQKESVEKKMEPVEPPRPETKEKAKSATEASESPPAAALLPKATKAKGVKSTLSGWSRLKKHMVVEQEEPKFPDSGIQKEMSEQDQSEDKKADGKLGAKPGSQEDEQTKGTPKATKMWDAVLFQMFSTKESIMHQIELNRSEDEKEEEKKGKVKEVPSFVYRLPVLLFSPRFDAKKLKEAASRPVTKISTVFEMGLIGRKTKDEEPKDFNRTARGFTAS